MNINFSFPLFIASIVTFVIYITTAIYTDVLWIKGYKQCKKLNTDYKNGVLPYSKDFYNKIEISYIIMIIASTILMIMTAQNHCQYSPDYSNVNIHLIIYLFIRTYKYIFILIASGYLKAILDIKSNANKPFRRYKKEPHLTYLIISVLIELMVPAYFLLCLI